MEPIFTNPDLQRYTQRPFPLYRYLPGLVSSPCPYPRNAPSDRPDPKPARFTPDDWRSCDPYLYGIDLFNHGYWWEAHEVFETVWLAAGQRTTVCGRFVQGLIQLAAAQLKRFTGEPQGARSLTRAGIEKLSPVKGIYLGIEIAPLIAEMKRCLDEDRGEFPRIELHF